MTDHETLHVDPKCLRKAAMSPQNILQPQELQLFLGPRPPALPRGLQSRELRQYLLCQSPGFSKSVPNASKPVQVEAKQQQPTFLFEEHEFKELKSWLSCVEPGIRSPSPVHLLQRQLDLPDLPSPPAHTCFSDPMPYLAAFYPAFFPPFWTPPEHSGSSDMPSSTQQPSSASLLPEMIFNEAILKLDEYLFLAACCFVKAADDDLCSELLRFCRADFSPVDLAGFSSWVHRQAVLRHAVYRQISTWSHRVDSTHHAWLQFMHRICEQKAGE